MLVSALAFASFKDQDETRISRVISAAACRTAPFPGAYLRVLDQNGNLKANSHEFPLLNKDGKTIGIKAQAFGSFYVMSECGIQSARLYSSNAAEPFQNPPKLVDSREYKKKDCRELSVLKSNINLVWYKDEKKEESSRGLASLSQNLPKNNEFVEYVVCAKDCRGKSSVTYYRVSYLPSQENGQTGTLKIDTEESKRSCPFK